MIPGNKEDEVIFTLKILHERGIVDIINFWVNNGSNTPIL